MYINPESSVTPCCVTLCYFSAEIIEVKKKQGKCGICEARAKMNAVTGGVMYILLDTFYSC